MFSQLLSIFDLPKGAYIYTGWIVYNCHSLHFVWIFPKVDLDLDLNLNLDLDFRRVWCCVNKKGGIACAIDYGDDKGQWWQSPIQGKNFLDISNVGLLECTRLPYIIGWNKNVQGIIQVWWSILAMGPTGSLLNGIL